MTDFVLELLNKISFFDSFYLLLTTLSLIKCTSKGFVLSLLSASKWLLAYVLTLFLFPKFKPFFDGILDNEYVLDIVLGISLFIIIAFLILLVNKGMKNGQLILTNQLLFHMLKKVAII